MYHQARKLAGYSLVVMAGFVVSRLFGLIRNVVVAQQFGTGREYEAFIAALTIPDLVFQILAGGAVGAAFIPVFKGYFADEDESGAWRLTSMAIAIAVATARVKFVSPYGSGRRPKSAESMPNESDTSGR